MKNIGIICNCRVVLLRILLPIGPTQAIFSFLMPSADIREDDFSGRVVGFSDGDTIIVIHEGRAVDNGSELLLASILTPEIPDFGLKPGFSIFQ